MNGYGEDNNSCCYFHPKEIVVGVCPLCLNERLVILASKQASSRARTSTSSHHHHHHQRRNNNKLVADKKSSPINLPKIFPFSSFLNRFEFKHWKSDISDNHEACSSSSSSQEDSFISIKFEDNGVASWEKGTVSKVSLEHCSMSWNPSLTTKQQEPSKVLENSNNNNKSVIIEHAKPRAASSLRWRKRIGHLFQLARWKRSNKANVCHVSSMGLDGVKGRKGWMRTLSTTTTASTTKSTTTTRGGSKNNKGRVV